MLQKNEMPGLSNAVLGGLAMPAQKLHRILHNQLSLTKYVHVHLLIVFSHRKPVSFVQLRSYASPA